MSFIGYARVSTSEGKQLLDRQVDALKEIGCERIFEDKASGSNSQRKGLDDCLNYLRKGDVLVVLDLDRLGRLASELIKLIDELAEKDIGFKAINHRWIPPPLQVGRFYKFKRRLQRWSAILFASE